MKYFLIVDFGTMIACERKSDIYKKMGYKNNKEVMDNNGGVMPDIYEITEEEYENNDYYDVF